MTVTSIGSSNVVVGRPRLYIVPIERGFFPDGTFRVESSGFFVPISSITESQLHIACEDILSSVNQEQTLRELAFKHEYTFKSITELLKCCSDNINRALQAEAANTQRNPVPVLSFHCESDNTISLIWRSKHAGGITAAPAYTYQFFNPSDANEMPVYTHAGNAAVGSYTEQFLIAGDDHFRNLLPSLPWVKCMNRGMLPNLRESYFWFLDTRKANVSTTADPLSYTDGRTEYTGTCIKYNFVGTDAVTNTDINNILVSMSGVAYNQQVYPINPVSSNLAAALTTTIPIIDSFIPFWNTPSEMSSEMVVSKTDFSNSAPVNINPSLLKERIIKFKFYYTDKRGRMHELTISPESDILIQIVVALERF